MATRKTPLSFQIRIIHRYLGFFLAGIMAVYALSGITLIFRDSDTFKNISTEHLTVAPNLSDQALGKALNLRRFTVEKTEGNMVSFRDGTYNKSTGEVQITRKQLPYILDKLTHFHKAKSGDPLYFLNIFFGLALLFFVVSAFWMYTPKMPVFKKGMYFALAGIAFALLLLFV